MKAKQEKRGRTREMAKSWISMGAVAAGVSVGVAAGVWWGGRGTPGTQENSVPPAATEEVATAGAEDVQAAAEPSMPEAEGVRAESPSEEATERTKTITLPGGAEMEMAWCPAGSFMMGETGGQHLVTLSGFWIAKHEVTQKQWVSVMGSNPSHFKGDDLPVECVNWNDCVEFCKKAGNGLRLPTESQWEYACRAGSTTEFFWGDSLNGDMANCNGEYPFGTDRKGPNLKKTTRVGSYEPNAWGVYDMHGNVQEWCSDWHGAYPDGPVTDPQGASSGLGRISRGGAWFLHAGGCRSALRTISYPLYNSNFYGFRPVMVLQ